jgi:hypothetical protein
VTDELKIVTRGARYPRKYKKIRRLAICDQDGQIVATVSWSHTGLTIDRLEGYNVHINDMNGLGQYNLEDEPEAPHGCPHCVEDDQDKYGRSRPSYSWARKWADGAHPGIQYRVVCKRCGGALIG